MIVEAIAGIAVAVIFAAVNYCDCRGDFREARFDSETGKQLRDE